ncbi:hypothetical protein BCR39DRAFT_210603 [Naematelia encephala]|uniref:Zn(2)-C6 fungal-type domain-containing protein n=1 Tax=Naematelia encephala TaxID=71784 RepID=A0A1Y2B122_9TREE|nr:hypothetical protein BCR39DRAFT_210603 [Naematelia encephala]
MSLGNDNGSSAAPRWDQVPRFSVSDDRDNTPPSSGNLGSVLGPPAENPERVVKRMRTRRACDGCRSRKIRCQYPNGREAVGSCAHCELHGLACVATKPTVSTLLRR